MATREELLAASLTGSDIRLIPYFPYLLQDIFELGSDPEEMVRLLHDHVGLHHDSRVIDLGCGKGAVSLAIAREFGCTVLGIDLMADFVRDAQTRARSMGLSAFCSFRVEDIAQTVSRESGFDVAVYGAEGTVLGDPVHTLLQLRRVLRPRGRILLDDAYADEPGTYLTLSGWQEAFDRCALEVVAQRPVDPYILAAVNNHNQRCIERRAAELSAQYPDLSDMYADYVVDQQAECDELEQSITGVTWLLQLR